MVENISLGVMSFLPLVGISLAVKESIRKQHPKYGQQRIEVAHIVDEFLGGTGKRENLEPMTIPEHLVDHVTKALNSDDWVVARKQYGAAHLIACRATEEELEQANNMLAGLKKKR